MSEWDEIDFDDVDEEIAEALESDHTDELLPEDVFSMVMLNRIKQTKVTVEIRDADNDVVHLPDLISQILSYTKDKLNSSEGNEITDQLMPLVSQALVSGLGRLMGLQNTAFLLCNNLTKDSMIHMMVISLLLLKFVQENNLTIFTHEEAVSEEEMEEIERKAKASGVATMGSMLGMDPVDVLKEMFSQGQISKEDLEQMIGTKGDDEDGSSGSSN